MRLFIQLTDDEKNGAMEHCVNAVIEDLFEDSGFIFEMLEEQEVERLNLILEEAKQLEERQEQVEFIMGDEVSAKIIFKIAEEMAKATYYHEPDELILFTDTLVDDETPPEEIKQEDKKYSLN